MDDTAVVHYVIWYCPSHEEAGYHFIHNANCNTIVIGWIEMDEGDNNGAE